MITSTSKTQRPTRPEPARAPAEGTCYSWVDRETGEELLLEASGCRDFLAQLEGLGFERRPRSGGAAGEGVRRVRLAVSRGARPGHARGA